MNLQLVKASYDNQALVCDMMEEWYASGEHIVPWAITKTDCHDYDRFLPGYRPEHHGGSGQYPAPLK